jgi:hypothetical protein
VEIIEKNSPSSNDYPIFSFVDIYPCLASFGRRGTTWEDEYSLFFLIFFYKYRKHEITRKHYHTPIFEILPEITRRKSMVDKMMNSSRGTSGCLDLFLREWGSEDIVSLVETSEEWSPE